MKRFLALAPLLLTAACGAPSDRLSDEDAAVEQTPAVLDEGNADSEAIGAATELPEPEDSGAILYKAVGNEPGWALTIGEKQISYIGDYGEVRITQPKPEPLIGIAGETYRTPRLEVNIVHGECSDGMSEYVYADKVQVTADGKRVEGCGGKRTLPPGASPP